MNKQTSPVRYFFHIQVQPEIPQIVFPTRGQQVGDRTNFVREEPLDLSCLTKIVATCVVEDVSLYLGTVTLKLKTALGASSNFTCV